MLIMVLYCVRLIPPTTFIAKHFPSTIDHHHSRVVVCCCTVPRSMLSSRTRPTTCTTSVATSTSTAYLQQSVTCPLLKDGRATLGSYQSCRCYSCILLRNLDIPRYTSLRVLKRVRVHHIQADQKLERTRKQDASRDQKKRACNGSNKQETL